MITRLCNWGKWILLLLECSRFWLKVLGKLHSISKFLARGSKSYEYASQISMSKLVSLSSLIHQVMFLADLIFSLLCWYFAGACCIDRWSEAKFLRNKWDCVRCSGKTFIIFITTKWRLLKYEGLVFPVFLDHSHPSAFYRVISLFFSLPFSFLIYSFPAIMFISDFDGFLLSLLQSKKTQFF